MLKKIMKQVVSGMPGPNRVSIPRDLLATAILTATRMMNNIPYRQVVGNTKLLAPSDFITPWHTSPPSVRDLLTSILKSLSEAKQHMDVTQERIRHIVREENITSPESFRQGKMKLASNKPPPQL